MTQLEVIVIEFISLPDNANGAVLLNGQCALHLLCLPALHLRVHHVVPGLRAHFLDGFSDGLSSLLNIFVKGEAVVLHDLYLHELISAQFAQQVSEHCLAFDSETQLEDFDSVTHFLCLSGGLLRFRTFQAFFVVLLEVNLKGLESRVKVNDVIVFDAEFCDLLRFIDLAVGGPNDTLDGVDPLEGAFKIQRAVLPCRQNDIESIDLEMLGLLKGVLVYSTTSAFR